MGEHVNKKWVNWVCITLATILVFMNFYMIIPPVAPIWAYVLISLIGAVYLAFIGYLIWLPIGELPEEEISLDKELDSHHGSQVGDFLLDADKGINESLID
jgi:threonine/homoserine/homoserine lactone efflux protein